MFALLLFFAFLLSVSAFAQSKSDNNSPAKEQDQSLLASTLDPHKLSGILVFILAVSTALSGVLMKKRKAKPKTHHFLAYTTLIVALAHGIYNLLAG
jgi:cytochrome b561